jgi:CDP-diacylglycerol--glycerol-3-phosphate 3-phosphatidyltransferase
VPAEATAATASPTFGPGALATPANAVTAARLLVAAPMVALIAWLGASWAACCAWALVAGSDSLDGWVARRQGATRSGAFLDPLADKVAVLGALVALSARGSLWWLPVALIAARELCVSAYRSVAGRRGVSLPASGPAKVKTWAQMVAVALLLLPPVHHHAPGAALAVVWVAVALTVLSGVQYLLRGVAASRQTESGQARR